MNETRKKEETAMSISAINTPSKDAIQQKQAAAVAKENPKINDVAVMHQLALLYVEEAKVTRRYLGFLVQQKNDLNNANIKYQNQLDGIPKTLTEAKAQFKAQAAKEHVDFAGAKATPEPKLISDWISRVADGDYYGQDEVNRKNKARMDAIIKYMAGQDIANGKPVNITKKSIEDFLTQLKNKITSNETVHTFKGTNYKYVTLNSFYTQVPSELQAGLSPMLNDSSVPFKKNIAFWGKTQKNDDYYADDMKDHPLKEYVFVDRVGKGKNFLKDNAPSLQSVIDDTNKYLDDKVKWQHLDFNKYAGMLLRESGSGYEDNPKTLQTDYYYDPKNYTVDQKAFDAHFTAQKSAIQQKMHDVNNKVELINEKMTRISHYAEQYLEMANALFQHDYQEAKSYIGGFNFYR